ncbi:uncharacterized protein LOC143283287 [Babylonia areolata]|uniref:uncharacterized protein LOC143283287 n=1 Tax=Babylonia areolata TaxID=304850 RepID=UPI003FD0F243
MPKRSQSSGESSSSSTKVRKTEQKTTKKADKKNAKEVDAHEVTPSRTANGQAKSYPKEIDPKTNKEQDPSEIKFTASPPTRNKKGELVFEGAPDFRPNMTPKEVMQAGSFGGTYFRPIKSGITGKNYSGVWKELPKDWLEGLNIAKQVSSSKYDEGVNTYQSKCGGSLEMWESSGWIHKQDPYGWFQWYCRFYQGRRTADDDRQIGRWLRCAGTTGRWRNNLISKCVKSGASYNNHAISPVVRQTLQHWGYKLTKEDYDVYAKKMKQKGQA